MFKRLFDWLFPKEQQPILQEVTVHDFTAQREGRDIAMRYFGESMTAEAVLFTELGYEMIKPGELLTVTLDDNVPITFVIEECEYISLTATKVDLIRVEEFVNAE